MSEVKSVQEEPQSDLRTTPVSVPWSRVLILEIACYVVLIALACIPGSGSITSTQFSFTACAVAVMIILLAFFAPLRDGLAGRIISIVLGLCGMVVATTPALGQWVFEQVGARHDYQPAYYTAAGWMPGVAVLLVTLIVLGFIRQMARPVRTNMLVQMSHMIMDGVCSIAASGWIFLPLMVQEARQWDAMRIGIAVVVVLIAVALCVVSHLWYRDAQPLPEAQQPWIGFALMPVMLTGAAVGTAALVMSVV